ncbi:MAG: cell division protein FtsA [Deltaproteobacteria bacterium]|nr:cell division protein FtsA [Deltaproteobacteria bacterium]
MAENDLIAGLDLGTTKVCVIVAERTEDGLDVIGIGSEPCQGLKKGMVIDIDTTIRAIRAAVDQVETMAGCDVGLVYAGIAGSHVKGFNKDSFVAITDHEVTAADVKRVLDQSKAFPLKDDMQVIHVLPQEFAVDEHDGIKWPVSMNGIRLEARVHVVTASNAAIQNIMRCAERCDLQVAEVVLEPLASAEAVLSQDEKEIGVALIDIGGGTTDIIVYVNDAVVHTSVIPIGGVNLTKDISAGLRTSIPEAERIKVKYGCASASMIDPSETIEVPSVGGRPPRIMLREVLAQIIEPRVEEIIYAAHHVLTETGFIDMLASGVVITGGATLLDGMPEMAEHIMGIPVRRGNPIGVGGLVDVIKSPAYATAVGLIKYGANQLRSRGHEDPGNKVVRASSWPWSLRLGGWIREVF